MTDLRRRQLARGHLRSGEPIAWFDVIVGEWKPGRFDCKPVNGANVFQVDESGILVCTHRSNVIALAA